MACSNSDCLALYFAFCLAARGGAGRQNVGQESFGLARERHRVAGRAAVAARARPRRRVWRARRVRRVCVRLRRGGVRGRTIRGADGRGASVGGGQQIRRGSGAERRDGGHAHPHPALGRRAGGRVRESRGRTGRRNVGPCPTAFGPGCLPILKLLL
ncbi:hypothetical protein T492DRAFT_276407 [Pavlovales sp. CCMP2436]|nr:hypothetical protein T492DRAFT_276407 [Pavlovales sp. CCMP2436]